MSDSDLAVRPPSAPATTRVRTSSGVVDTSSIVGWGVDADPDNDPTYSVRDRSGDDHRGEWRRPTRQTTDIEVLQSVEHKQRPAVFGTASPPKWVSGMMRRAAFRWTESHWAHWLLLLGADRVNMVEGLVEDVARAKIPNVPKEMGLPAAWRHNKAGVARAVGIGAAVGVALFAWSRARSNHRRPGAD